MLGDRPDNYATRLQWERGVWAIETYRHRHGTPPNYNDTALGREPARGQDRQDWRETLTTIRQVRAELRLQPHRGETPELAAPPDRIAEPALDHGLDRTPIDLGYDHQPPLHARPFRTAAFFVKGCGRRGASGRRRGWRRHSGGVDSAVARLAGAFSVTSAGWRSSAMGSDR